MITLKSELSVASCICQMLFFQSLILISIPLEQGDNEVDYFFSSVHLTQSEKLTQCIFLLSNFSTPPIFFPLEATGENEWELN